MPTYFKETNGERVQVEDTRIAVVMVGLPARGKSLIAQKGMPPESNHACMAKLKLTALWGFSRSLPGLALDSRQNLQRWLLSSRRHASPHRRFLRYRESGRGTVETCGRGSGCGGHDHVVRPRGRGGGDFGCYELDEKPSAMGVGAMRS